ncbi:MAG: nitrite/sulfite reductase [Candidatus Binatia bacterium]
MTTWKERLQDKMPPPLAREIDIYETQLELKRQGKIEDKLFAETRLRRGVYGQRYDNGHRHDGVTTKQLGYPSGELTKGPETLWDAPGMQRIKIPFGGLNPEQMETLAALAEEYSDAICHVTTRQDIQLHYVHIDDTPSLMRRLATVGITTREACGNSVRNVTACPLAGVCRDETFDVTPYAKATAHFLLGHPDVQDFGRKFKIAFSGCQQHACGLVALHDLGYLARTRLVDGQAQRGFAVYVGGGLGTVPYQAKLLDEFVPEDEILPLAQAIARVFARLGEKRNRARARIKFLVNKLGIDEFRRLVGDERRQLPADSTWTAYLAELPAYGETPLKPGAPLNGAELPEGFDAWRRTNVHPQKQAGYVVATVTLPLGDITAWQMRQLADIARRFIGDSVRTTVEQNIVLRWVSERDLPDLYRELQRIGLALPGAGTILDVTACPGTDTCKLGIASARGLADELRTRLAAQAHNLDAAVNGLRIKISGCFNSCGQHHISDLGFYGVSRNIGGTTVPHFLVVLGGKWEENAGAYGLAIAAVPSKRIPDVVTRITERYVKERLDHESFQAFIQRIGKKALREMFTDLAEVPPYSVDRSYYSDWGDPREFTIGDMGKGECAGEVVSAFDFDIQAAERLAFEAQLRLDEGDDRAADDTAYRAMLQAARALIRIQYLDVADEPDTIVQEFRRRFYETGLFADKYAGSKFAQYLFRRHQDTSHVYSRETAHHLIEEAQLFIEAAHACRVRVAEQPAPPEPPAGGLRAGAAVTPSAAG